MWVNRSAIASYVHVTVCVVPSQGCCMPDSFIMSLFHTANYKKLCGNEANFFHASAAFYKVQCLLSALNM